MIGSVLDQRYVVVEPLKTEAHGVRFVAYDMLHMSHVEILVRPDASGELSGTGYVRADPPKNDRSPERGLGWSEPPPTKAASPRPETPRKAPAKAPSAKAMSGPKIVPAPALFSPPTLDPLTTIRLDESDLVTVGLVGNGLELPSAAASLARWGQHGDRDEVEREFRRVTRPRRRYLWAALLGFGLTAAAFLMFGFPGRSDRPVRIASRATKSHEAKPTAVKPTAVKPTAVKPTVAPGAAPAPAPAPEKPIVEPPGPTPTLEKPAAKQPKAVSAPKKPALRRPKPAPQKPEARRARPRRGRRLARGASRTSRRRASRRRASRVDADAILAVARTRPRELSGTVDPFGQ